MFRECGGELTKREPRLPDPAGRERQKGVYVRSGALMLYSSKLPSSARCTRFARFAIMHVRRCHRNATAELMSGPEEFSQPRTKPENG